MRPTRIRDITMTREEALKIHSAIKTLFSFSPLRYKVAIKERYEDSEQYGWEVHLFVMGEYLSGLTYCAILSNAIQNISRNFLATDSEYEMSICGEPRKVRSFKIW